VSIEIKVLVVDDEPVIRSLFKDLLTDEGYRVNIVSNGQEAVDVVRQEDFNLVFMDVHMPVMNGLEALIEMKQMRPYLTIVMMDSFPDQLALESEKRGAITCIHKPFNIREVTDLIRQNKNKKEV
jgi:CheY-like chemotaxis protein